MKKTSKSTPSNILTQLRMMLARHVVQAVLIAGLLLGGGLSIVNSSVAHAEACPTPATNYGTLTVPIKVQADGEYVVWSRLAIGSTDNNTIDMQVNSSDCFSVGGSDIPVGSWKWINYADGATSKVIKVKLKAGSHKLKFVATKPHVLLDRVILSPVGGCTPTEKGDNCQAGDGEGPAVDATTDDTSDSKDVKVNVNANDKAGIKEVQLLVDGVLKSVDTTYPYAFDWDSKSASNGTHNIVIRAIDNSGNATLTKGIVLRVFDGGSFKKGDVNHDGAVNVKDLSVVLTNWGKPNPEPKEADTNGDKTVNMQDLSAVFSDWGK